MTQKSKIPLDDGDQPKSKVEHDVEELDSKLAETKLKYDASPSPTQQSPPPAFSEVDPLSTTPPPNIFGDPMDVDELKHDSDGDSFYSDFEHLGEDILPSGDGNPADEWEHVLVGDRSPSPQVTLSQDSPSVHSPPESPSRRVSSPSPPRQQTGPTKLVKLAGPLGRPAPGPGNTKDLLCIVCKVRPQYNQNGQSYPTCGLTCANKLSEARAQSKRSSMSGGPTSGRGSGTTTASSRGSEAPHAWQGRIQGKSLPQSGFQGSGGGGGRSTNYLCQVCRERPRYQKGGKLYPTCGLNCASKQQPKTTEKCDFCKQRPKVVLNGVKYPHCGRTCRDKAQQASEESQSAASCPACMICWKARRNSSKRNDFCSQACLDIANENAPLIMEIPRGHDRYKQVMIYFTKSSQGQNLGKVKRIYMIQLKPGFHAKHEEYKKQVAASGTSFWAPAQGRTPGNEKTSWLGLVRSCGLGDAGNTKPCSDDQCLLCCLVRSTIQMKYYPDGILTADTPAKAMEVSIQTPETAPVPSKVLLISSVVFGREAEMELSEQVPPLPPQGYHSVRTVARRKFGKTIDHGERSVFTGDAVKPLFLLVLE